VIIISCSRRPPQRDEAAQTAEHVKASRHQGLGGWDLPPGQRAVSHHRAGLGAHPQAILGADPQSWNGPYLKGQSGVPKDRWGNEYLYLNPGAHNPDSYDLWTRGQDGQDGGEGPNADVGNWAPEPETQQTAAP
jgi:hypothetical protein